MNKPKTIFVVYRFLQENSLLPLEENADSYNSIGVLLTNTSQVYSFNLHCICVHFFKPDREKILIPSFYKIMVFLPRVLACGLSTGNSEKKLIHTLCKKMVTFLYVFSYVFLNYHSLKCFTHHKKKFFLLCVSAYNLCENALLYTSQENGVSPTCVHIRLFNFVPNTFNCTFFENNNPQISERNGILMFACGLSNALSMKMLFHTFYNKMVSLQCLHMTF